MSFFENDESWCILNFQWIFVQSIKSSSLHQPSTKNIETMNKVSSLICIHLAPCVTTCLISACLVLRCLVLFFLCHLVLSCLFLLCFVFSSLLFSSLLLSSLVFSCHVLSGLALPSLLFCLVVCVLSCLSVSCLVFWLSFLVVVLSWFLVVLPYGCLTFSCLIRYCPVFPCGCPDLPCLVMSCGCLILSCLVVLRLVWRQHPSKGGTIWGAVPPNAGVVCLIASFPLSVSRCQLPVVSFPLSFFRCHFLVEDPFFDVSHFLSIYMC